MEITALFFSDYAGFKQGSLNILCAGYNTLEVKKFPYELHGALVAMVEVNSYDAAKSFKMHIEAVDEDGKEQFHFHGDVNIMAFDDGGIPGRTLTAHQVLPFAFKVEKEGALRVHVTIGESERSTAMYITQG